MADVVKCGGAEIGHTSPHFFDQIGYKSVEHAIERFIDGLLGRRRGKLRGDLVVEASKEWDMAADICDVQNARVKAIIEVGGDVGDFVGKVNELRLERWAKVEKVLGEIGMGCARVIA